MTEPGRSTTPFPRVSWPVIGEGEAEFAYAAAQKVVLTHRRLIEFLKVGQTLAQIDLFVARTLADVDCRSCFLGYRVGKSPAFPSHACLSVNDCIVHGTAASHLSPMRPGDVLKIDIGVWHKGWIGDAAWTYAFADYPSARVKELLEAGRESLRLGIARMQPGMALVEYARAVQNCVEHTHGFRLTRGLGGHGIGRKLHAPPYVSNVVPELGDGQPWAEASLPWVPGTLVAVEPMLAISSEQGVVRKRHDWPVYTADGSVAAHFEHDVLVTTSGPRVLTEGLDDLPLVVG
ncbi:MAG: methionyl aminopeptidase [Phycisphaeraceae bacterium]|nr:methionyl aminopeptidase [Phycisphaeraceae bacterium]